MGVSQGGALDGMGGLKWMLIPKGQGVEVGQGWGLGGTARGRAPSHDNGVNQGEGIE